VALNSSQRLPHTIGADDASEIRTHIGHQATNFLSALRALEDRHPGGRFDDHDAMRIYALDTATEEQSRIFEARLRNLLSAYDTFLRNSVTEEQNADLPEFRDILITAHQLQQIMTHLAHFYERHENDIRGESSRRRVIELVDKNTIVDRTLNFSLFYVRSFMELGRTRAERMLEDSTRMRRVTLSIPDGCVLHARPASLIARVAQHHGTNVKMTVGGDSCSAASIMQVILLIGENPTAREVTFTGDEALVADLEQLFAVGLGEGENATMPEALAYLRQIPRRDHDS
jgi:phosphotransferase system HPr (HPr) family protein